MLCIIIYIPYIQEIKTTFSLNTTTSLLID